MERWPMALSNYAVINHRGHCTGYPVSGKIVYPAAGYPANSVQPYTKFYRNLLKCPKPPRPLHYLQQVDVRVLLKVRSKLQDWTKEGEQTLAHRTQTYGEWRIHEMFNSEVYDNSVRTINYTVQGSVTRFYL